MKIKLIFILFIHVSLTSCSQEVKTTEEIIEKYSKNCAKKYNYNYDMKKWQDCLNKGLKIDSTIAYLWQQKAMPYFKAKKYEVGMKFIDKAVKYDKESYLPYRAFIKCIFAKTYKDAIIDFEECKKLYGNSYVMDHTYNFYISLCYLQLNEYQKATKLLDKYVDDIFQELGEDWVHPTALFYLGISKYELEKYDEAIVQFDRALKDHPNFADANYYKSVCLGKLGKRKDAKIAYNKYVEDVKKGYTMNEDNVIYEIYPYQKKWHNR